MIAIIRFKKPDGSLTERYEVKEAVEGTCGPEEDYCKCALYPIKGCGVLSHKICLIHHVYFERAKNV